MIQATMMCFNEQDFIECYLDNVMPLVDKILILDGGSTDGTLEKIDKVMNGLWKPEIELRIIKQQGENYNDPVYNHQQRRNLLYSFVDKKADYIFNLDCDENLIYDDYNCLRELIKSNKIVYEFPRYDMWFHPAYYREDWSGYKKRVSWLWKANIGIKYDNSNPPHELPSMPDGTHLGLLPENKYREVSNIPIHHYHYCWGKKAMRDFEIPDWKEFLKRREWVLKNDNRIRKWEGKFSDSYIKYCEKII